MFDGYLALGSAELLNSARTEAYVAHQAPGMSFKRRAREADLLHLALGDNKYESPALDDAPWFDPRYPETGQFYGLYPLEVQGLDDSTLSAGSTELIGDGAVVGSQRETSRSVRVHGLLVGATEAAVQAGLAWLGNVVRDPGCSVADDCGAGDLSYFRAEPRVSGMVWLDQELPSRVERFGTLASGKTLVHRFTSHEAPASMPMRVAWSGQWGEGCRYVFGALAADGSTLESSGPVVPFRRNYFKNPSFRTTVAGVVPATGSLVARDPDGGVSGGSGARATGYTSALTSLGYGDGVYGEGVYAGGGPVAFPFGDGTFGDGVFSGAGTTGDGTPDGYGFGDGSFGDGGFGGIGPDVDTTDPTGFVTEVVAVPVGMITASLALRSDVGAVVTVTLIDVDSGLEVDQTDHVADDSFTRVAVTGTVGAAGVQISVIGSEGFDFDQILIERGSVANGYFDGDSRIAGYDAAWEGHSSDSTSTLRRHAATFVTARDGGFSPFLQSLEGGTPQVRMTWWGRAGIDPVEQVQPLTRILHGVHCVQGPKVITRYSDKGGWYIELDLLFTAEIPTPFTPMMSLPVPVVATTHFIDTGEPAELDALWLYDPAGPSPSLPPTAPLLLPTNTTTVLDWRRTFVEIPAPAVAESGALVPQLVVTTGAHAVSSLRLRFHPNPFDFPADQVDPLSYCGEFQVSYLPARTRLVLNGITERATASQPGRAVVSAGHLISSGTGGAPMVWPVLSCGMSYVLTVDVPTAGLHDYDLQLQVATRE